VEDRLEYGLTLVAPDVGGARGAVTLRDVRVVRLGPPELPSMSPCGDGQLPPYALDLDVQGTGSATTTLDRIELRSIVGNGLVL
jgi:hypothetical protein